MPRRKRVGLGLYRLEGKTPVRCDEGTGEWARWFEHAERKVAETQVGDVAVVSTVFLGVDHNFTQSGPPILFETMIFEVQGLRVADALDDYQERYSTWAEAEAGHARAVALVKSAIAVKIEARKGSENG